MPPVPIPQPSSFDNWPLVATDRVVLYYLTPYDAVTVFITCRILLDDGRLIPYQESVLLPQALNVTALPLNLPQGRLMAFSVKAENSGSAPATAFCSLVLSQGTVLDTAPNLVLASSTIGIQAALQWPVNTQSIIQQTQGYLFTETAAAAAGGEFSFTPPFNRLSIPRAISARLTTSSVAANRLPKLQLSVNGVDFVNFPAPSIVTASQVVTVTWATAASQVLVQNNMLASIPKFPIHLAVNQFRSNTSNIQATDQWDNIVILYEAFPQP